MFSASQQEMRPDFWNLA